MGAPWRLTTGLPTPPTAFQNADLAGHCRSYEGTQGNAMVFKNDQRNVKMNNHIRFFGKKVFEKTAEVWR